MLNNVGHMVVYQRHLALSRHAKRETQIVIGIRTIYLGVLEFSGDKRYFRLVPPKLFNVVELFLFILTVFINCERRLE